MKLYGAEVKKNVGTRSSGRLWNWELFKQRLSELGQDEVTAAKQIIEWAGNNDIELSWGTSQIGSFIPCFETPGKRGFYPFSVTGEGMIAWNAPPSGGQKPMPVQ